MDAQTKKQLITALRNHRGSVSELARRHGCSLTWVQDVFDRNQSDDDLVVLASQLLVELESSRAEKIEQVKRNLLAATQAIGSESLTATY